MMPPKHFECAINKLNTAKELIVGANRLMVAIGVYSLSELEQTERDIESAIRILRHESTKRDAKDYGTMAIDREAKQ